MNVRVIPTSMGNPKPADGRHPVAVRFTCTAADAKQQTPVPGAQLALRYFHDECFGPPMSDGDLPRAYIDRECSMPYDPAAQPAVRTDAHGQLTLYFACAADAGLSCYVEASVADISRAETFDTALDPNVGQRAPLRFTQLGRRFVTTP